jgi:hypothetical protein
MLATIGIEPGKPFVRHVDRFPPFTEWAEKTGIGVLHPAGRDPGNTVELVKS